MPRRGDIAVLKMGASRAVDEAGVRMAAELWGRLRHRA